VCGEGTARGVAGSSHIRREATPVEIRRQVVQELCQQLPEVQQLVSPRQAWRRAQSKSTTAPTDDDGTRDVSDVAADGTDADLSGSNGADLSDDVDNGAPPSWRRQSRAQPRPASAVYEFLTQKAISEN
jgi:hypothetical protein